MHIGFLLRNFILTLFLFSLSSIVFAGVLDGARTFNGHYYKIFKSNGMKWEDAKYFCMSMGGHLATAETRAENDFIKAYAKSTRDNDSRFGCYMGAVGDDRGFVRWLSGNIIEYSDWAEGQPGHGSFYRMTLDSWKEYKWSMISNDSNGYGFGIMCEWDSANQAHESKW